MSGAAAYLCHWARGLLRFHRIYTSVEPVTAALEQLNRERGGAWRGQPSVLRHAAPALRDSDAVVLAALASRSGALRFASERLRAERSVALTAAQQGPEALECVLPPLRPDDPELLDAARPREAVLTVAGEAGLVRCMNLAGEEVAALRDAADRRLLELRRCAALALRLPGRRVKLVRLDGTLLEDDAGLLGALLS